MSLVLTNLIGFGVKRAASGGTPATWDAAAKGSSATLSNSDRTITIGAANQTSRATGAKSSGLWYAELTLTTGGSGLTLGVCNSSVNLSNYPASDANFWGYYADGRKCHNASWTAYGSAHTTSDVVGIALNMTSGKVWFRLNGTWQNSGDPAAGTGEAYSGLTGSLMLGIGSAASSAPVVVGNWGQAAFSSSAPSGFEAWTV